MKKRRSIPALLLAVCLLVACTGCASSSTAPPVSPTSGGTDQTQSPSQEPTDSQPEKPEEITLTMIGPLNGAASGVQTSTLFQLIKDRLNINIDIDFAYTKDKYLTQVATNSLPDVSFSSDIVFDDLIKAGVILDMEPYLQTNGPNILKYADKMINYVKQFQSSGTGKVYFLNHQVSLEEALPAGTHVGPTLRWDYYKELGAPVMKSDRDFVDVVKQMLEAHPTNEEGLKNVGISLWGDWGPWTPFCWGAYALNLNETYWPVTMSKETGELVDVYGDKGQFRYGMEFLNYAYRQGVLDPDSFTQKIGDVQAKAQTAQMIATVLDITIDGTKYLESKGHTGKGYTGQLTPAYIEGSKNAFYYYTPTGRAPYWVISSNTKYPERCVDFLNLMYDPDFFFIQANGVEGDDWTVDADGNFAFTDAKYERMKETQLDQWNKYGFGIANSWTFQAGGLRPDTGTPFSITNIDPAYYERNFNTVQKDVLAYYGVEIPKDLIEKQFPKIPRDNYCVAWSAYQATVLPDDMKLIQTNIDNYLAKQYVTLAMCKTEEAFEKEYDNTIAKLKELRMETLREFLTTEANKALEATKDFT